MICVYTDIIHFLYMHLRICPALVSLFFDMISATLVPVSQSKWQKWPLLSSSLEVDHLNYTIKALALPQRFSHRFFQKNCCENCCPYIKLLKNCCSCEKKLQRVWTITTFLQFQLWWLCIALSAVVQSLP